MQKPISLFNLLALFIFLSFNYSYSQTTWDGGGGSNLWSEADNWSTDIVPTSMDDVIIGSGFTVYIDADAECSSLTLSANSSNDSIYLDSGVTLTVTGDINFNEPTVDFIHQTIHVGDGNLICQNIYLANTTSNDRDNFLYLNNGTITVINDLRLNGGGNENRVQVFGNGIINIGGTFFGGRFDRGNSTVNYNGTSDQVIYNYSYYNLGVSNGGVKSLRNNTLVYNDITLDNKIDLNSYQLRIYYGNIGTSTTYSSSTMLDFQNGGTFRVDGNNASYYEMVYPIGTGNDYTPFEITSLTATIGGGYLILRVSDAKHVLTDGTDNALGRNWEIQTSNINGITDIQGSFSYLNSDADAPITETDLLSVGRLSGAGWQVNEVGTGFNHTTDEINVSGAIPELAGSWTLGESTGCFDGVVPTKFTVTNGNWNSTATWNNGVIPVNTDDVVILHQVTLNTSATVNSLDVKSSGNFDLNNNNLDVTTTTTISGNVYDNGNNGEYTFNGKLTVEAGGSFSVVRADPYRFAGGITNNGTFIISSGTASIEFITNSQIIDGTSSITFAGNTNIASGISVTNRISEINDGLIINGTLNGADATSQLINETLLSCGATDGPMRTTGVFDADFVGNIVKYTRNGTQYVTPTTYHDLTFTTTGSNRYRYLDGNTIVNNDFTIEKNTRLYPISHDLTVLGNAKIEDYIYDQDVAGTLTFQDIDISGANITGNQTGEIIVNGNITMPNDNAIIGNCNLTANGLFTVADGRTITFNNTGGSKIFIDKVTVEGADGEWVNSGNESFEFRNGFEFQGSLFTSGTGTYLFTNNDQSIISSKEMYFSGAVTVGSGITLTNNNSEGTTGISINGVLDGIDGTSVFQNNGVLTYLNQTMPMTTGSLDANTISNTINYARNGGTQYIFPATYDTLILSTAGNKRLTDSTTVSGHFATSGSSYNDCRGFNLTLNSTVDYQSSNSFVTGSNVVTYGRSGNQDIISATYAGQLNTDGSGVKSLSGDVTVTGNISVGGTSELNLNSNNLITSDDINISSGSTLNVNENAQLSIANTRTLANLGIFKVVGTSGNIATITRNGGSGGYSILQNTAGAEFHAKYYQIEYVTDGVEISDGAIDAVNNFSDGTFSNGTGSQYLNLNGIDLSGMNPVVNTIFETGSTSNVMRTSGTGAITFEDAGGALAGENLDVDNGNPGTLINWTHPSSTYYSKGNLPAGLTTSWSRNPDGSGANPANVTDGTAILIVQDGHTITVDNNGDINVLELHVGGGTSGTFRIGSNATQQSVTIQELLKVNAGATVNAGSSGSPSHTLNLYGNIENDGTINLKTTTSNIVNAEVYGNLVFLGSNSPIFNDITFKDGSSATASSGLDINGNVFIENNAEFNDGGASINVEGNWSVTGNGQYTATGTVIFDGLVNTISDNPSASSVSFNNVTFSGVVGSIQENTIVNGDFLTNNNCAVSAGNIQVTNNGNFTVEAGASYSQNSNATSFESSLEQTLTIDGTTSFYNLYFLNGGANAKTIVGDIVVSRRLIIYNGATIDGSDDLEITNGLQINGTCNLSGNVILKGGSLFTSDPSNTLSLGTAKLIIDGYAGISYSNPATSCTANVNNDVEIINGYLILNTNTQLIGQPGNMFKLDANRSLYVRGVDNFPTGFGTYELDPTSWTRYDRSFDQVIRGNITYGNLLAEGSSTTKTVDGPLDINGHLDLNSATTLDLQNFSHTLGYHLYNNTNSSIEGSSSTFTFDGNDISQTIQSSGTGAYNFGNLNFTQNAATANRSKTFSDGSTINVSGDINMSNIGGAESIKLILDLNANGIGGSPTNMNIGSYCQISTENADFGSAVTDNFTGTKSFDVNSTVYYSYVDTQIVADGFTYGNIAFNSGNKIASGAMDIDGNIYRATGNPVFYDGGFTHTVAGNWLLNNTNYYTQSSATGTIVFDGVNQDVDGYNFNNIIVSNSGIASVTRNLYVYGDLTVNGGGSIEFSTRNMYLGGNLDIQGEVCLLKQRVQPHLTGQRIKQSLQIRIATWVD